MTLKRVMAHEFSEVEINETPNKFFKSPSLMKLEKFSSENWANQTKVTS